MTASQIGKTEILNNMVGYLIDQDPCPILLIAPTVEMAASWSKDRIQPTIDEMPRLREKVRDAKSRDSDNTIVHKRFKGGYLAFVGANAPAGLAQRPIRVVIGDDVDRFPKSAGVEGDPMSLAKRRTSTFWNKKIVKASTPTIRGLSRIEDDWEVSDQRRYHVPCPLCGHEQILKWSPDRPSLGYEGGGGIVYEKDAAGKAVKESARYQCEDCGGLIDETEKWEMLRRGKWIAGRPGAVIRGYHISAIYSPWVQWGDLVAEWDSVHAKSEELKTFINTALGEPWEEEGEMIEADALRARMEVYPAKVPNGVGALIGAVDVQGDRLELVVKGYGADEESWTIDHLVFGGDPGHGAVWGDLDRVLLGSWRHESGRDLKLAAVAIDSGGHHTDEVYKFCAVRERRWINAIKGQGGPRDIVTKEATRTKQYRSRLYIVGVDTAKDKIWSRLKTRRNPGGKPTPGYIHLPNHLSDEFIEQLVSERPLRKWFKGKGWRREWVKVYERNEAWDLEVYALAALYIRGTGFVKALAKRAEELAVPVDPATQAEKKAETGPRKPLRPKRRGWVGGW